MKLTVNGTAQRIPDAWRDETLLSTLREYLGLVGTRYSCGTGLCGACKVLIDGAPISTCSLQTADVADRTVVTIEGLARPDGRLHQLQQAWIAERVPQCGYCQSGQIIQALAACLRDDRQAGKVTHSLEETMRQRLFGIALGYPDANDATALAAVTIDFESVSGSECPAVPLQGPSEMTTQGFTLYPGGDPPGLLTCDSTESLAASNDSHYLLSGAEPIIGLGLIQVQRRTPSGDRLPFSALAFDATEFLVGAPGVAVRVYAFDDSENIVADQIFVFDGAIDGPGGVDDFETFVLPASFQDVFAVTFLARVYRVGLGHK